MARSATRRIMHTIAVSLNRISGGKLSPNAVTLCALALHLPVAYLIAIQANYAAAATLVVFGLMDTLDGELARLQGRASVTGMLLDASTDRLKETALYVGAAYALLHGSQPDLAMWAVAACGLSISVSYVKAKGETAIAASGMSASEVNRFFQDGLLRFEVRMAMLVIGLLFNFLGWAIILIAVLSGYTVAERLIKISRHLGAAK